jgi:excisionase family DNA binding protein
MKLLDLDERSVRRLIDDGDIEAHRVGKRGVRVFLDSVSAYQTANIMKAAPVMARQKQQHSTATKTAHRAAEVALRKSGIIP